jgi:selenocysteine lyase/cysteine desulfurase
MDIRMIRSDFPALSEWIYLDNAFVGLIPRQVKEGYDSFVDQWYIFQTGGENTILQEWLEKARKVRGSMAKFIHVSPDELAFTTCTGSGLNIVVNGTEWQKGDNTIFPEWEHNPLDTYMTRRLGVESRIWKPITGKFLIDDLEKLVDDRTKLVQVSEVSYVNGFRFNLKDVAEVVHDHGAKLLVDATQAVGALNVEYRHDEVDYVSFAPYKYLMGPAGLAFLYIKKENISELTPDRTGWKNQIFEGDNPEDSAKPGTAEKFEYGTINFQGVYAIDRSLQYLNKVGINNVEKRNLDLSKYLYDELNASGKSVWTPEPRSTIVSFFYTGALKLANKLKENKIKVTGREAHGDHIRVSVHFYNTMEDIDKLMNHLT